MKKICFLINKSTDFHYGGHNCVMLSNACLAQGYKVYLGFIDTLVQHNATLLVKAKAEIRPLSLDDTFIWDEVEFFDISQFDALWVLAFGQRASFLDKMELLWHVSHHLPIINSVDSLLFLNSKYSVQVFPHLFQTPETYVSNDFDFLWAIFEKSQSTWIVKPPAESMGRDVFILKPGDTNARALLQSMTGYTGQKYCILQKYLPEIQQGEKRVLLAAGEVVGQYKRLASADDHRTNLHQGAKVELCDLTPAETDLCQKIGQYFGELGCYFMGLDLVYPYILEFNVLNPGGLSTIKHLSQQDLAPQVVYLIMAKLA
jgi:glutathione synthase